MSPVGNYRDGVGMLLLGNQCVLGKLREPVKILQVLKGTPESTLVWEPWFL